MCALLVGDRRAIGNQAKSHRSFKASTCITSADVLLMKASHMAKLNIKEAGKYTQPILLGDTVKSRNKEC